MERCNRDSSSTELTQMYNDLKPTPRKVVRILNFPSGMTQKDAEVAQHVKSYIQELNEENDLLVSGLVVQTSFTRQPTARTCICICMWWLQSFSWVLQWGQCHSMEQHLQYIINIGYCLDMINIGYCLDMMCVLLKPLCTQWKQTHSISSMFKQF